MRIDQERVIINGSAILKYDYAGSELIAYSINRGCSVKNGNMEYNDNDLINSEKIPDLQKNGIYFLIGYNWDKSKPYIYIGKAPEQNVINRVNQHLRMADDHYNYWTKALLIISSKNQHLPVSNKNSHPEEYYEAISWLIAKDYNIKDRFDDLIDFDLDNKGCPSKQECELYRNLPEPEKKDPILIQIFELVQSVQCDLYNSYLSYLNKENSNKEKVEKRSTDKAVKKEKRKQQTLKYGGYPNIAVKDDMANKMVNSIFDSIYKDVPEENRKEFISKIKFLDIACKKECEILLSLKDRLSKELDGYFENDDDKELHIVNNQLFGLTTHAESVALARIRLNGNHEIDSDTGETIPTIQYIDDYLHMIKDNGHYMLTTRQKSTHSKLYDKILKGNLINTESKVFNDMTFDVVIGNPPYNDDTDRGNGGGGNSLYLYFVQLANEICTKYSCLIIPSNWMIQYPQGMKHDIIDTIRKESQFFNELHDFINTANCFQKIKVFNEATGEPIEREVSIPGGVCYYIYDKGKKINNTGGTSKHYIHKDLNTYDLIDNDLLYSEDYGVIFRDKHIIQIMHNIKTVEGEKYTKFSDICAGSKHYFDDAKEVMLTNWKGYSLINIDEFSIEYYVNPKTHKDMFGDPIECAYVSYDQIPHNKDDYKKYKLIVGEAFTAGSRQIIDIPRYIGNNSVCSQSYIPIFSPNDTEEEILNVRKYVMTKFFRYLVYVLKLDQHLPNRVYRLIPVQNFTKTSDIDWSKPISDIDKQLYKKYKLDSLIVDTITGQTAAQYIDQTIAPME